MIDTEKRLIEIREYGLSKNQWSECVVELFDLARHIGSERDLALVQLKAAEEKVKIWEQVVRKIAHLECVNARDIKDILERIIEERKGKGATKP